MIETKVDIKATAMDMKDQLIEWRRHLHKNPELSFEEFETSKFILKNLEGLGYEIQSPVAKTGIVALLKGKSPGKTIAIRADMDALPIQDAKDVEYKSTVENVAHLCGHDAHVAVLLGVAHTLSKHPPEKGAIKLIFQPAEEGLAGAKHMVEEGVLENPSVDAIIGLHVHPTAKTGETTVAKDVAMACSDFFDIEIIGKGGHAAHPHLSNDPLPITAQVICGLQTIVSRTLDPLAPAVVTIGKIEGGYKRNIIAPKVRLEGTVRVLDNELRETVKNKMEEIIKGITSAHGATYTFDYVFGYPAVVNSNDMIPLLDSVSQKILGDGSMRIINPSMGGEDFAYYALKVPGLFFRLGTSDGTESYSYPNHHPHFDIDETALPYGVAVLSQYALDYLTTT